MVWVWLGQGLVDQVWGVVAVLDFDALEVAHVILTWHLVLLSHSTALGNSWLGGVTLNATVKFEVGDWPIRDHVDRVCLIAWHADKRVLQNFALKCIFGKRIELVGYLLLNQEVGKFQFVGFADTCLESIWFSLLGVELYKLWKHLVQWHFVLALKVWMRNWWFVLDGQVFLQRLEHAENLSLCVLGWLIYLMSWDWNSLFAIQRVSMSDGGLLYPHVSNEDVLILVTPLLVLAIVVEDVCFAYLLQMHDISNSVAASWPGAFHALEGPRFGVLGRVKDKIVVLVQNWLEKLVVSTSKHLPLELLLEVQQVPLCFNLVCSVWGF